MRRFRILLPLAVLLLAWASCTTVKHMRVDTAASPPAAGDEAFPHIVGYTTADAVYHPFDGFVRLADPDSLRFYRKGKVKVPDPTNLSLAFTMARADVASLSVRKVKVLATIGVTVVVATVIVAAIVAATEESKPPPTTTTTSCPFVYSWDGKEFVLDAEPYGGATIRALERTDVTELEHLAPSNGRYRLLLTNEMDESQHTNRIDLMIVDHAPGVVVAVDPEGNPHAFQAVHRLVEARDQAGRDLLPWLRDKDQAIWHPDLEAASRNLPPSDTRDHITLTFDRPAGARNAYLLADAATAPWGARMIRTLLAMRGATLGLFYAAINSDEGARRKLHEWNEREELFYLGVEVEEGGRWVRQGHLIGGGPVVAETRAIPLDLSRVTGDRVRVRIHPPVGFWMFNAFRLADGEVAARAQVVAPLSARDGAGKDVLATLARDDEAYDTFATNEDRAVVGFPAPPQAGGTERTVFARTRGWYEIRMGGLGIPDFAALRRTTDEPGFAVVRALEDYRAMRDKWSTQTAGL